MLRNTALVVASLTIASLAPAARALEARPAPPPADRQWHDAWSAATVRHLIRRIRQQPLSRREGVLALLRSFGASPETGA